jgi:hypothetical protein
MDPVALTPVSSMRAFLRLALFGIAVLFPSGYAKAQNASIAISVKDHRFQPAQISGPANRPLSIGSGISTPPRWSSRAFRSAWKR